MNPLEQDSNPSQENITAEILKELDGFSTNVDVLVEALENNNQLTVDTVLMVMTKSDYGHLVLPVSKLSDHDCLVRLVKPLKTIQAKLIQASKFTDQSNSGVLKLFVPSKLELVRSILADVRTRSGYYTEENLREALVNLCEGRIPTDERLLLCKKLLSKKKIDQKSIKDTLDRIKKIEELDPSFIPHLFPLQFLLNDYFQEHKDDDASNEYLQTTRTEAEVVSAAKSKAANRKVFIILGIVLGVIILIAFLCMIITSSLSKNGTTVVPTSPILPDSTQSISPVPTLTKGITTYTFDIDARVTTWFDTGISIQISDEIRINASGTIDFGGVQSGPDGSPDLQPGYGVVPTAPYGALIGMIRAGDPFIVGSDYQETAQSDGTLKLLINDVPDQYNDNSGQFHVTITITKGK
jgi:hypothetical protein